MSDRALRYYATAYLNTDESEAHTIAARQLILAYMRQVANVMVLVEDDDLDDQAVLKARSPLIERYLDSAGTDPWTPPAPTGTEGPG